MGIFLSCLLFGFYFIIFYIVLSKLGAHTTFLETSISAGLGVFIGALSFIPMGMGTRDASTCGALVYFGTDYSIALTSIIIMRSLFLSLILVSGFCYFVTIFKFKKINKQLTK